MGYTRQDWSRDVFVLLGNLTPTANMVKWVAAWTLCETLSPDKALRPSAQYNLLNTRYTMAGSYESHDGVQSYLTYMDGLQATVNTLGDGSYPFLLSILSLNDESLLGFATGVTDAAIVVELEKWSGGKGYGTQLFQLVGQGMDDVFAGGNTFGTELAAEKVWRSTAPLLTASYNALAPYYTKIALAWRQLWLDGKYPGPPVTPLYLGNDDKNEQVGFQEFTNLHATINQNGEVEFYNLVGALAHPVKIFVPRDAGIVFDGFQDAFSDGQPTGPQPSAAGLETPDKIAAQKGKLKKGK